MTSGAYWEKRAIENKKKIINASEKNINNELKRMYKKALSEISRELERLYNLASDNGAVGLSGFKRRISEVDFKKYDFEGKIAEAVKMNAALKKEDLPEEVFKKMLEESRSLEAELRAFSRKGYASHLELMELNIQREVAELNNKNQINMYKLLADGYNDGYFRGIYDIQSADGFGYDFARPNARVIKEAVMRSWSKKNYSERIWSHGKDLAKQLKEAVTVGTIRGEGIDKITRRITDRIEVSESNARRLVRTETAQIYEKARVDGYKECGIERYKFLATLDRKTSKICQELDGKVFLCFEGAAGKNMPPMHPNCRSTIVPYREGRAATERAARGADGKYYKVPSDMTYKEWFSSLSKDDKGRMRLDNLKDRNKSNDKKSLERLKKVTYSAPTLDKYQDMKYNKPKEFELIKGYKAAVRRGDISPLIGLDNYKKAAKEADKLIGTVTSDGIEIKGYKTHFIDRIIGQQSAEDEPKKGFRKGVRLEDVKEALLSKETNEKVNDESKISRTYFGDNCVVTINPDTGDMVQTNPRRTNDKDK